MENLRSTLSSIKFPAIWILEYSDGDGEFYLCVYNIFEIFDELWTLSSIKFPSKWNFLLSSNIRMEMENLPYLCVCIFEIFDELWTLLSIKSPSKWNFLLSSNIRMEMENLPYLCVCNMHIFEIFDELWTLSSNFLRNEISCYLNRQIFGWRWRILLVRMYIRNLRWIVDSFVHQISCYLNSRIFG